MPAVVRTVESKAQGQPAYMAGMYVSIGKYRCLIKIMKTTVTLEANVCWCFTFIFRRK